MALEDIHILLGDDDKDDCLFFNEALEELQMSTRLTVVDNGEQLLSHLQKEILPDVLFLDLNMPRKSGFACLEEIKGNESLKQIPVIIYSTSYEESIANELYKKGAHYYICKPGDFVDLKKIVKQALQLILTNRASQPTKEKFLLSNLSKALR